MPEPSAGTVDLLLELASAGVTAPPGVTDVADRVHRLGLWQWGTTPYEAEVAYMFYPSLIRNLVKSGRDHALLCHAGHGINSYGLTFALVRGPLAVMTQHHWGGVYADPVQTRAAIASTYARLHGALTQIADDAGPVRWIVELSTFRDVARLTHVSPTSEDVEELPTEAELFAALDAAITASAIAPSPATPATTSPRSEQAEVATRADVERAAYGDSGPWVEHLAAAWQACAAPQPPARPPFAHVLARPGLGSGPDGASAWSPLLHILMFGLGWSRPDLGLAKWDRLGRPVDDPVLAVAQAWWGPHLEALLAFLAGASFGLERLGHSFAAAAAPVGLRTFNDKPLADTFERLRVTQEWQGNWGGGWDPMHLSSHVLHPVEDDGHLEATPVTPNAVGSPRAAATSESYAGWYRALMRSDVPTRADGHDVRVDVTCAPVGWLGRYRRSRVTGLWFRSRHAIHMLGN